MSSEDDIFIDHAEVVSYCNYGSKANVWSQVISIESKNVNVKTDTGADVSIIPSKILNKIGQQSNVTPANSLLKAFEESKLRPIGSVNLHCTFKDKVIIEKFMVIETAEHIHIIRGTSFSKPKIS